MSDKIIAIDFDGTIVSHMYPEIGREVPNAFRVMKKLQLQNTKLILWTMRFNAELDEAVAYCAERGVFFWGVNCNPQQIDWTGSPKAYAHLYIDDAALGCPTLFDDQSGRHMVNWRDVEAILIRKGILIS